MRLRPAASSWAPPPPSSASLSLSDARDGVRAGPLLKAATPERSSTFVPRSRVSRRVAPERSDSAPAPTEFQHTSRRTSPGAAGSSRPSASAPSLDMLQLLANHYARASLIVTGRGPGPSRPGQRLGQTGPC